MKSQIQQGAWIIAANKVLSTYSTDHPAFDPLETTIISGRAGELFSAIRSLGVVKYEKFDAFRKYYKLKRSETTRILKIAEELERIVVTWDSTPDANQISEVKLCKDAKDEVYELTAELFFRMGPSKIETAVLEILSSTLLMPQTVGEMENMLSKIGLSEKEVRDTLALVTNLKLLSQTEETDKGQKILFNPHAFECNAADVFNAINGLSPGKKDKAIEILEFTRNNPGIPLSLSQSFDTEIVKLLTKVGLIDYSAIITDNKESKYFPTSPHIWGVISKAGGSKLSDDLIDDAKLLLNSFRYGQFYSTPGRGKIKDPFWIVSALIRDGAIGIVKPATAIGTDYPLALSRGIVNIVESRIYPGRYSMELMKYDVAEAVKDVIDKQAIYTEQEIPSSEELERAGQLFISPGAIRVETQLPAELENCKEEIIHSLRTMRSER